MAKRKKSNMKDTSSEVFGGITKKDVEEFVDTNIDAMQFDLEDEIEESKEYTPEEKIGVPEVEISTKPQFKNPNMVVKLAGTVQKIDNTNLTEALMSKLINDNICSEDDFC